MLPTKETCGDQRRGSTVFMSNRVYDSRGRDQAAECERTKGIFNRHILDTHRQCKNM